MFLNYLLYSHVDNLYSLYARSKLSPVEAPARTRQSQEVHHKKTFSLQISMKLAVVLIGIFSMTFVKCLIEYSQCDYRNDSYSTDTYKIQKGAENLASWKVFSININKLRRNATRTHDYVSQVPKLGYAQFVGHAGQSDISAYIENQCNFADILLKLQIHMVISLQGSCGHQARPQIAVSRNSAISMHLLTTINSDMLMPVIHSAYGVARFYTANDFSIIEAVGSRPPLDDITNGQRSYFQFKVRSHVKTCNSVLQFIGDFRVDLGIRKHAEADRAKAMEILALSFVTAFA
ncbi:hypothetical protein GJ496_001520 [Pomphorhynchus laevis]|nr:hypothetical protein GJ496_001520 [Pomphorhynchus laevis]